MLQRDEALGRFNAEWRDPVAAVPDPFAASACAFVPEQHEGVGARVAMIDARHDRAAHCTTRCATIFRPVVAGIVAQPPLAESTKRGAAM